MKLLLMLLLLLQVIVLASSAPVEPQVGGEATAASANTTLLEATTMLNEDVQVNQNEIRPENEVVLRAADALNNTKTEQKVASNEFIGTVGTMALPDQDASASSYEPAVYANLITPETFQQYVNQFGAAYAPYAAAAAAAGAYQSPALAPYPSTGVVYPAPATATATYPFPAPYVVQTGYEGYLVPTATTTTAAAAATTPTNTATTTTSPHPSTMIGKLLSTLMMTPLLRITITIISTIAMVLFGNLFAGAICRLTPLCDLSTKTITYLRSGGGAQDVGRMITEEMTPERVRRATEFVRNAIRKYRALQQLVASSDEADLREPVAQN